LAADTVSSFAWAITCGCAKIDAFHASKIEFELQSNVLVRIVCQH